MPQIPTHAGFLTQVLGLNSNLMAVMARSFNVNRFRHLQTLDRAFAVDFEIAG